MTINQQVNIQFNVNINNPQFIDSLTNQVNNLNQTILQTEAATGRAGAATRKLQDQNDLLRKSYRTLAASAKAFVTFEVSRFLSGLARDAFAAQDGLERLEDQLVALGGNAAAGAQEFDRLQRTARDLPATFTQVAQAGTKLDILGLDASVDSLRTFLDLSAGLGKPVEQITEAFADAGAGFEFERLKELGIVARQETDSVIISFRGMEQEVDKTSEAVIEGLLDIGRTNFSGAAELQTDNFTTQFLILREQLSLLVRDFADASGIADAATGSVASLSSEIAQIRGVTGLQDLENLLEDSVEHLERMQAIQNVLSFGGRFFSGVLANGLIAEAAQEVENYRLQIQLLQATQANVSDTIINRSLVPEVDSQSDQELKAFETFVSGLERQAARLQDVSNEAALIKLIPTLTDDQRDAAESLIDTINSLERQNELRKEASDLTSDLATKAAQARQEYDAAIQSIADVADAGLVSRALADSLDDNALTQFREKLLTFIGPAVIIDGTQASIRAAEAQTERLNEVFRQGTIGQAAIQEFQLQQQQDHLDRVNQLIQRQAAGDDPFIRFEQQLLEGRRAFLEQTGGVTNELTSKFAEYRTLLQQGFLDSFTIDIDRNGSFGEQIAEFNTELAKLTETTGLFTQTQITDEQIEQYQKLARSLGLEGAADGIGAQRANIEILTALNQQLVDVGAQTNEDFFDNEADLQRRRIQLWQQSANEIEQALLNGTINMRQISNATNREIVQGFLGAASSITSGWEEQSRTIFELNKILDIGMAINNYFTGITAAWAQGGPLGFISGLLQTGVVLSAISRIQSNEFGNTSTPSASGAASPASGLSQQVDPARNAAGAGANIIVNVQGDIIDEGGLQEAIINGVRTATNNRQVRLGNSTFGIRR